MSSYSDGMINVFDLCPTPSSQGVDRCRGASQLGHHSLPVSYNELLPAIPLWERYTNNALNRNFIMVPDSSDSIFANFGGGADNWMTTLILTGVTAPADM